MGPATLVEFYVMLQSVRLGAYRNDHDDPSYAYVDEAMLVEANAEVDADNPCVGPGVLRRAPVMPTTPDQIRAYAAIMGWQVSVDSDGTLTLHTNVSEE